MLLLLFLGDGGWRRLCESSGRSVVVVDVDVDVDVDARCGCDSQVSGRSNPVCIVCGLEVVE